MLDDLKFAWRRLRHAPGFPAAAVITLALAIGVNTAIFSIADAVLFRPPPYTDPDRVYVLQMLDRQTGTRFTQILHQYLQAINEHRGLGEIGMYNSGPRIVVVTDDGARSVPTLAVTANYFQVLGARPARGRLFDSRDSAQPGRPAILSYAAWQQQFGGDEQIVGRSVTLGTTTFEIVGILPAGFVFPSSLAGKPEVVTVMAPVVPGAAGGTFHPIIRLKTSITPEQAQAEIETLVAPLMAGNTRTANLTPVLSDIRSVLYPVGRPIVTFLLAAAILVLLIGCANLAIMLLSRSKKNEHEIGVRTALGASRIRLVRPLIFEAILLSLAGAMLAVLVTVVTFKALVRQVPPIAYGNAPVGVDLRVVLFTLGLGLFAGFVFSVVPAWRSARLDAQALIQGHHQRGIGRRGRLGRSMITAQVALALALVFGAVIAGRAFLSVLRVPLGFTPENVVTIRVNSGGKTGADRQAFYVRTVERLAQRSDAISVGAAGSLPLDGSAPDEGVRVAGSTEMAAGIVHVLPGYFETIGLSLVRGRLLNWDDIRGGADVAVISESAARRLFPDRNPLGATFTNGRDRQFIVVGVVADVRKSLERESAPLVYVIPGDATRLLTLVVRTRTRQEAALAAIRREISTLAPGTPVTAEWWANSISALTAYRNPRFQTLVLGMFAGLALGLTALGIFGVVAFSVATRTHEMGIRLALGASPRSLVKLMVKQTLIPVAGGILIGLVVTRWASRLAEAQLFQVETRDPVTLTIAVLTVVAVALLAAYVPARRASRVDPMVVLRAE